LRQPTSVYGRQTGQALLEMAISFAVITITLTGASWVLKAEWNRFQCAYLTFEAVHAKMTGSFQRIHPKTTVVDNGNSVIGLGVCGGVREQVELPYLEAASW
jgi:hypothetical protein